MKSNIFNDLTKSYSTPEHERKENQLTAAFLAVLRMCPELRKKIFKKHLGANYGVGDPHFYFQPQYRSKEGYFIPDGGIKWDSDLSILIENKIDAKLSQDQIEKYRQKVRRNRCAWFLYKIEPPELRHYRTPYFKKSSWFDIYEDIDNQKRKNPIIREFIEYLKVMDLKPFSGFSKRQIQAWHPVMAMLSEIDKFIEVYSNDLNEGGIDGVNDFECDGKIRHYNDQTYIEIRKKYVSYRWGKTYQIYLGVCSGDWNENTDESETPPYMYLTVKIRKKEYNKIKNRGSYKNRIKGIKRSGFDVDENREWVRYTATKPLEKVLSKSKSGQFNKLQQGFTRWLKVADDHILHSLDIYKKIS